MRTDQDRRYDVSVKLADLWLSCPGHTQCLLARLIGGVSQSQVSRYLSGDVECRPPSQGRICEEIFRVCRFLPMGPLMIDALEKVRLQEAFEPVEFWPVADDSRAVIGLWTAHLVNREIKLLLRRGRQPPVFLNSGGQTVLECACRLGCGDVRHWSSVWVGPLNEAAWADEREDRGAVRLTRALSASLHSPLLPRVGLDVADRPGVALLSAGGKDGFPCQWLERKHVPVPSDLVGDFNYHLLLPDGNELIDQRLARALAPLRYFESLAGLRRCLRNKTVILALCDAPFRDLRDDPPPGSTKARLARACLAASLPNIMVLPVALAKKLLDSVGEECDAGR